MILMLKEHNEHHLQNDLSVQRFDKLCYLESFLSKSLLFCWPSLYSVRATDTRNRPRFSSWGIVLSSSRSSNHSLGNVEMIWKSRNRKSQNCTVTWSSTHSENDAIKTILFDFSHDLQCMIRSNYCLVRAELWLCVIDNIKDKFCNV